jgi:hypothetical protein
MSSVEQLMSVTYENLVWHKALPIHELVKDLKSLISFKADVNERKFCGNKTLYHFMLDELCRVSVKNKPSLYDIFQDPVMKRKLAEKVIKLNRTGSDANRMFEAERFNGAVVFFKPATAKFLYKKFQATHVLDPTAGWGGRMLGAWSLGIPYTGFDTNTNLTVPYENMKKVMEEIKPVNATMNWQSCLEGDFANIDYDFVLTSPPYINLETYSHMSKYESNAKFYKEFLIPLIEKCLANIKRNGWVCFNISPEMYKDLVAYGMRKADMEEDLLQQKKLGKDKCDKIYCWK